MCILFAISIAFLKSLLKHNGLLKNGFLALMPVTFFGSILACGSRGSFIALGLIVVLLFMGAKRKILTLVLISLVLLSTPYIIRERDIERTMAVGTESDITGKHRLERWQKGLFMVGKYPLLGVGYKNWGVADKQMFGGTGDLSHNIFIECMSELGYSGLGAFILLILYTVKNNLETIRIVRNEEAKFLGNLGKALNLSLVGYIVAGFFVTVLYYPYFWVNLAMTVSLNNIVKKKVLNVQRQTELS